VTTYEIPPSRRRNLARIYGLTTEDFVAMLTYQDDRCAMCLKRFSAQRVACVEHDHRVGEVTMLACSRDNGDLLGVFGRDPAFYRRVADVLENPPAREALGRRHFVPSAPPREEA
jgi:predicted RNA methylase